MKTMINLCCLVLLVIVSGCASIDTEKKPIVFTDTTTFLRYHKLEPDSFETEGLKLRLYQQNKVLKYLDLLEVFSQISGKKGIGIKINKTKKVIFAPGISLDNFFITTETTTKDLSASSSDKLLMSNQGEILKFFFGNLKSSKGDIEILSWSRTPIFPKKMVKIGDKWSYVEEIKVKLKSFWISRDIAGPEKIIINCKLTGFAEVRGRRCAVIETQAVNTQSESYTAIFKTMKLKIRTQLAEKIFFDYKRGLELGRISTTHSFTTSEDSDFSDISQSQSISVLDER